MKTKLGWQIIWLLIFHTSALSLVPQNFFFRYLRKQLVLKPTMLVQHFKVRRLDSTCESVLWKQFNFKISLGEVVPSHCCPLTASKFWFSFLYAVFKIQFNGLGNGLWIVDSLLLVKFCWLQLLSNYQYPPFLLH